MTLSGRKTEGGTEGLDILGHPCLKRKLYSAFNTVCLLWLFSCSLLVWGSCCLFLMRKMFYC